MSHCERQNDATLEMVSEFVKTASIWPWLSMGASLGAVFVVAVEQKSIQMQLTQSLDHCFNQDWKYF